ncbi:hypothetical protein IIY24_01365 [Candidatus Saccharibacteria bacterium]|nr:hypothetical protein [Candidatus Saccharibacteria bacterium]
MRVLRYTYIGKEMGMSLRSMGMSLRSMGMSLRSMGMSLRSMGMSCFALHGDVVLRTPWGCRFAPFELLG